MGPAPDAQPLAISDYPPFQLLPPEVQAYLLVEFAAFETTDVLLIPDETAIGQNYPNPFNPETWIPYQLAEADEVSITIYNTKGVLVRRLHWDTSQLVITPGPNAQHTGMAETYSVSLWRVVYISINLQQAKHPSYGRWLF